MLDASPALATASMSAGASRATSADYFLRGILRYVYEGDTALHVAAAAYDVDVARTLLGKGADPHARNRRGAEPLHAASTGGPESKHWNPAAQAAMIALLVGAGANPAAVDKSGVAPLHVAVRSRCAAAVRALLDHGANPRQKNGSGSTPLHLAVQTTGRGGAGSPAARAQQAEIVRVLVEHGARLTDRDGHGHSVKSRARGSWAESLVGA